MRDDLRTLVVRVAAVLILPFLGAYRLGLMGFDTVGTTLGMVPGFIGMFLRRAWYERTLESCGVALNVQFGAMISSPEVRIGNDCFIGHYTRVGLCEIGDDVMIGERCSILSGSAQYGFLRRDVPMRLQPGTHQRITLGDDIWVGAGVLISSDVASHSIVGAGAVVAQAFEEWQILSGVPAEPVATRPARRPRRARTQGADVTAGEQPVPDTAGPVEG